MREDTTFAKMHQMLYGVTLRNRKILKPLHWLCLLIGSNIRNVDHVQFPLRMVSLAVLTLSGLGLTMQCNFIWTYRNRPMSYYIEAICTGLQCLIGITEMFHLILMHSKMVAELQRVQTSEILKDLEIFQLDIFYKTEIIADIEKILDESWNNIKKQIHTLLRAVAAICCWYYFYCLTVNIYKTYIKPQDFDINFPVPAHFPIWSDKGFQFPYYHIQYIIVGSEIYISAIGALVFSGTYSVFSNYALGLLRIFRYLIRYITNDQFVPPKERVNYLKACIKLHQKIYEYCDGLNSIYKIECMPFFIFSMFVLCLLTFQASLTTSSSVDIIFRVLLYYLALIFGLTCFCVNGQRLISESELLSFALYECDWYVESPEFKFLIRFMIMRANKPVSLTIGGFTNMSVITLLAIIRSSGSYFLLLREVNDSN